MEQKKISLCFSAHFSVMITCCRLFCAYAMVPSNGFIFSNCISFVSSFITSIPPVNNMRTTNHALSSKISIQNFAYMISMLPYIANMKYFGQKVQDYKDRSGICDGWSRNQNCYNLVLKLEPFNCYFVS